MRFRTDREKKQRRRQLNRTNSIRHRYPLPHLPRATAVLTMFLLFAFLLRRSFQPVPTWCLIAKQTAASNNKKNCNDDKGTLKKTRPPGPSRNMTPPPPPPHFHYERKSLNAFIHRRVCFNVPQAPQEEPCRVQRVLSLCIYLNYPTRKEGRASFASLRPNHPKRNTA